jgi:hypothetical protein
MDFTSYEAAQDLQKEIESEHNAIARYLHMQEDALYELVKKGEIYRTHIEEFSEGHYTGTRYYFWAGCIGGVHTDLIRVFLHPSLFN